MHRPLNIIADRLENRLQIMGVRLLFGLFLIAAGILYFFPFQRFAAQSSLLFGSFLLVCGAGYILLRREIEGAKRLLDAEEKAMRDAFHDIRTPLSLIKTSCEIALLNDNAALPPNEARQVFKSNDEEIKKITAILERFSNRGPAVNQR